MRYWDSSAIVPLCVRETPTDIVRHLIERDRQLAVWWATEVECESALARRRRQGGLSEVADREGHVQLRDIASAWYVVDPGVAVRDRAIRIVRVHAISAADALQLSAALAWCEGRPRGHELVTLDSRLAEAARLEGFTVVPDGVREQGGGGRERD